MNLVKNSAVTLAEARVELDKVPKIVEDEGSWFVDLLPLKGSLCNDDSRLGVQVRTNNVSLLSLSNGFTSHHNQI